MIQNSNYRYLEMLSKLKKHYPDIDFGEVEISLHRIMEDTQHSLEVLVFIIMIFLHFTYQYHILFGK